MLKLLIFLTIAMCCVPLLASADVASQQEMRSLDEQVQEIKTDVLGIAAELNQLEEQLLYPSNSQVAVFVALDQDQDHDFRLDAVRVQIDGQLAAHHIYSFKELDALESGGVQRLFTGNLGSGVHQLEVSVIGKLASGKDFSRTEAFSFRKDIEPRLLGIAVAGSGQPTIELRDW